jgi:hypothetical protein
MAVYCRKENEMMNESKVLMDVEFEDSASKGRFNVKIIKHDNNIVFGECVVVIVEHDKEQEFSFSEIYRTGRFPEEFNKDLVFRGWDWVLDKIKESL